MMKFEMTYHAQVERLDRLVACIEHIGVGEVVREVERFGAVERLTDTGLVLIVNPPFVTFYKEMRISCYWSALSCRDTAEHADPRRYRTTV